MRKGFTKKPQRDEPATPGKNYITRSGLQRLKDEHRFLLTRERPAVTEVVAWAASNDRVSFRWKDYARGGKQKIMAVSADEFLRRFLIHVLPKGLGDSVVLQESRLDGGVNR